MGSGRHHEAQRWNRLAFATLIGGALLLIGVSVMATGTNSSKGPDRSTPPTQPAQTGSTVAITSSVTNPPSSPASTPVATGTPSLPGYTPAETGTTLPPVSTSTTTSTSQPTHTRTQTPPPTHSTSPTSTPTPPPSPSQSCTVPNPLNPKKCLVP